MKKFIIVFALCVLLLNAQPLTTPAYASGGTVARIIQYITKFFKVNFSKAVDGGKTLVHDGKILADDFFKTVDNVIKKDPNETSRTRDVEILEKGVEEASSLGGDD